MQIPKQARRKARELFDSALDATDRLDQPKALEIANLVVESAPRHALQILKEFTRLVRLETEKHHALIESALPVEAVSLSSMMQSLRQRDGGAITLETRVNTDLIGGVRIRLGSEVWETSVLSRLEKLSSSFS